MASSTSAAALIQSLNSLSTQGRIEDSQPAKDEALRLSKELTATLQDPGNIAVELDFAVCTARLHP